MGRDLPLGTPPAVANQIPSFDPFQDRASFELAEFLYTRNQTPAVQIDALMDIWASISADQDPPFIDHKDLYHTIDNIKLGDVPWKSFSVSYCGDVEAEREGEDPPWMRSEFEVWFRDPLTVLENQLMNPSFNHKFHAAPYHDYNQDGKRVCSDVMSGNWAWKQAVRCIDYQLTRRSDTYALITGYNSRRSINTWQHVCPRDLRERQDNCFSSNRPK